jgi:hypothetical protein
MVAASGVAGLGYLISRYSGKIGSSTNPLTIQSPFKFDFGVIQIPNPAKAFQGGEDGYLATDDLIVVADGTSFIKEDWVPPGLFSMQLCKLIGEEFSRDSGRDLKDILIEAV